MSMTPSNRNRRLSGRLDPGDAMPLLAVLFVVMVIGSTTNWIAAVLIGPGGFALGVLAGWFAHAWVALGNHKEKP